MGITLENVSYTYQAGTPFESPALVIRVVENQLFYNC